MRYFVLISVFLALGCNKKIPPSGKETPTVAPATKPPAPPPEPPEPPSLDPSLAVELYESLAKQHARQKGESCAELAERLLVFRSQKQDELKLINAQTWQKIEANAELLDRAQSAMEVVITQSMACKNDPKMHSLKSEVASYPPPAP